MVAKRYLILGMRQAMSTRSLVQRIICESCAAEVGILVLVDRRIAPY